jgi:hypothetical protein
MCVAAFTQLSWITALYCGYIDCIALEVLLLTHEYTRILVISLKCDFNL